MKYQTNTALRTNFKDLKCVIYLFSLPLYIKYTWYW